jgi:N-acetyl-alpha-D-glucosaminyl L-malate synthase BshA
MKIGIICYPGIGGSGLIATVLGVELARQGHEIHFISYSVPFKLPAYGRNIHFHSVDPISYPLFNQQLYTFSLTAKVVEVVDTYKIDVIHAHYSIPHSLCAHLAREISTRDFKIVTTLHGTDVTIVGQDKPLFKLNRYGIERSDLVTTVSEYQQRHTKHYFGIESDIRVIYNFIDSDIFRPRPSATPSELAAADEKIVMHISNFRPLKNGTAVIRSFHLIPDTVKARLVLVGDGPEVDDLRRLCRELDLADRVSFLGNVANVEHIVPLADCVLQPSYRESFGMALLEAMACGVPTVSSNVDGIPEVVVDGETGYTTEPDDYESIAAHVTRLCTDADKRHSMGMAGRARAIRCFNKTQVVAQYLAAYETVVDQVMNATPEK